MPFGGATACRHNIPWRIACPQQSLPPRHSSFVIHLPNTPPARVNAHISHELTGFYRILHVFFNKSPSPTQSNHCSLTTPVPGRRNNRSDGPIQTIRNDQSRHRGEHTRPGCRFPRPRGKPCAPGCIKRSRKVRAHYGEVPNAFRYLRHLSFRTLHPCLSISICDSKSSQTQSKLIKQNWERNIGTASYRSSRLKNDPPDPSGPSDTSNFA